MWQERQSFLIAENPVFNGDSNVNEIREWLLEQSWYKERNFDCRVGMGFCGGSLLGGSTSLWHVTNRSGKPVAGESLTEMDGVALAKLLDERNPAMKPHKAKMVWDSEHAAEMRSLISDKNEKPNDQGLEAAGNIAADTREQPTDCLLPEKMALLQRVTDSIDAMARALDQANGKDGGGAFFITNYFGLRARFTEIKRDGNGDSRTSRGQGDTRITPKHIKDEHKVLQLEPTIIMLQRICATVSDLMLVVPYPEDAHLELEDAFKEWSRTYPSRTTILVPIRNFKITTSYDLLAAITHAPSVTRAPSVTSFRRHVLTTRKEHVPRPCIVGVASGGYGALREMAQCSSQRHSVLLITLVGSGRLSDLWADVWPRRGEKGFDPVLAARQLHEHACYPPSPNDIQDMHRVLADGQLYLHKISHESATLERLCVSLLLGNRLLMLANKQMHAYEAASQRYEKPRKLLVNLSIILALTSTLVAVLVPESISQQTIKTEPTLNVVLYYLSIVLPALMLVVDQASCPRSSPLGTVHAASPPSRSSPPPLSRRRCQIEGYLGTQQSQRACKRAAGLVQGQIFRYKTQTGVYADLAIERANFPNKGSDSATARQLLFAKKLNKIQVEVAVSRAQVTIIDKAEKHYIEVDSPAEPRPTSIVGRMVALIRKGDDTTTSDQTIVGKKGTKEADELNGDEYIKVHPPAGPRPTVS